ncbi:hypothetical protein [Chondromyces crocatus]|uniref:Secreted protein n=1 Tax=Chondromyces crocatus TaxID=52 RepID=A0A0K1ESG1_CHOCO|nr:hypothetical protein [Chondromyces crocatus]AKT43806.1 uncharacterized protein CMC5_080430 [Chondromyces crocatus]
MNRVLSSLLAFTVMVTPALGRTQGAGSAAPSAATAPGSSAAPPGAPAPGPASPAAAPSGGSAAPSPGSPAPSSGAAAPDAGPTFQGIETVDGRSLPGRVVEQKPGSYAIVEREGGQKEAVDWSRIARIDGKPPPPVAPAGASSLIPEGFTPARVSKIAEAGEKLTDVLPGLFAPKDGSQLIGSVKGAQDALEALGLKRGAPNGFMIGYPLVMMPLCFDASRGTIGRVDGTGFLGSLCNYVIVPISVGLLVAGPFLSLWSEEQELAGPTVHHIEASVYALDYSKKSALTGSLNREPSGGFLGNNLGYDFGYSYIHPTVGIVGYGHLTLQQTSISRTDFLQVSSSFFKADAQAGFDAIRFLSKGKKDSYWSQHTAFFRAGPSMFHNWILSRDVSAPGVGAAVDNPLNNSIGLVTGLGYELAAELDFRFPEVFGWSLGGVHFKFERGSYPALSFPDLNPRQGAFVALIGFDDLRQGDSYTWQRLKLELELPINYSRAGGLFFGGQLVSYENNFGSGVDNRGLSLDYRLRFE